VACAQVPYGLGPVPFVTEAFIEHAHRLGLQVHAWTVNDAATMKRLLDLGIDGIMTDELVTLRDVMASRGLWPHEPPPTALP
jgi:glycerophosphoryl diester phosphodiesterase